MAREISIGSRKVGIDRPVYCIAEIGINHNGSLDIAMQLMKIAADNGCDAVKFQKRDPDVCVPEDQKLIERDTPWGRMTYIDYRYRVEFNKADYAKIATYAKELGIDWFASPWDEPSVAFLEDFDVPVHKVASASITDGPLLKALAATGKPIILSTGMSTLEDVAAAVELFRKDRLLLMSATSTYPSPPEETNLRCIETLTRQFDVPVGYSGHERGLQITLAAVALGAVSIERHITLDRTMWGSDQSASLEPSGLEHLIRDVRIIEAAMGDGVKRIWPGEEAPRQKLRRFATLRDSLS